MIIYFATRNMEILGTASTGLPGGISVIDDEKEEDIESGHASLSLTLSYREDLRLPLEQMTAGGNYVLREIEGDAECYTIIEGETETKAKTRTLYCEDAGLDLLNEICAAYDAPSAMSIAQYVTLFAGDSGFSLGVDELPNLVRKLSWDGESTAAERLRSVATQFDAELSYSYRIERMAVTGMYVNIWKKRGTDAGVELRLNRDINNIRVKESVANLITGLIATGGTPEGTDKPITPEGLTYDDGDIFLRGARLYCRSASRMYSRIGGSSYIMGQFSYETTSKQELLNRAVSHLKQYSKPEVNYECEILRGLDSCHIGDRVNIVDDAGGLYLSARILELTSSATKGTKTATLGEYLIRTGGISAQIEALAADFARAKSPVIYSVEITSSAGDVFIDTHIATTLTAHVYRNGSEIFGSQISAAGVIRWYDQSDLTTPLGTGITYTILDSDGIDAINITARLEDE